MIKRIKNFMGLVESGSGLWLFIRIGIWIGLVSILLRLISLPGLMKILSPQKISNKKWPRDKLVNFSSFWLGREAAFFQRSCLKRSLVLYRYLNMQSDRAQFLIGVRKEDGELKGHSWIAIDGEPLFQNDDISYRLIYSYPESQSVPVESTQQKMSG
jgi:hypothetical protein